MGIHTISKKRFGLLAALICSMIGYYGCAVVLRFGVAVPAILYWLFFLAIPGISLLLISDNEAFNVILLVLNSLSVYSIFFLQNTTWYPASRDCQYDLQIVSLIYRNAVWFPGMGTGFSSAASLTPAIHFFLASLSIVTGVQPYQAMFLIPWLKGVGIALFFYLLAREVLPNVQMVFLASMTYLGTFWYMDAPHRQLFAEILFIGILWIYFSRKKVLELRIVLILFMLILTMSHHFTSYVFLLLAVALYIFDRERRSKMPHFVLPLTIVLFWVSFVSFEVTYKYGVSFFEGLQEVLGWNFPKAPSFVATTIFYTPFESVLVFLNPLLISLLAFPFFLKEIRSRRQNSLVATTLVLGALLMLALLLYVINAAMGTAFLRIWDFVYIPFSIWSCLFLWKVFRNPRVRTIISVALIVILFASANLSSMESGIKKWYVSPGSVEAYMYSDSMVNTALWCGVNLNGSILGDHFAYDIIGTWGNMEVAGSAFQYWYQTKDAGVINAFDYVIISPKDQTTYLDTFRQPIDPFALLPANMSVVYSSGDLIVYRGPHG